MTVKTSLIQELPAGVHDLIHIQAEFLRQARLLEYALLNAKGQNSRELLDFQAKVKGQKAAVQSALHQLFKLHGVNDEEMLAALQEEADLMIEETLYMRGPSQ